MAARAAASGRGGADRPRRWPWRRPGPEADRDRAAASARRAAARSSACWPPRSTTVAAWRWASRAAAAWPCASRSEPWSMALGACSPRVWAASCGGPARPIAERPDPVAQLGPRSRPSATACAKVLLRRDPLGGDRLQMLAHLPLAAGQLLGCGRLRGRQAELGVGRGRLGLGPGPGLRRGARPSCQLCGQHLDRLGRRRDGRFRVAGGWHRGCRPRPRGRLQGRRGVFGEADGLGLRRRRVGDVQVAERGRDPALILGRIGGGRVGPGDPGVQIALVLGQLGGEVVGGDTAAQLLVQAIERRPELGLEAGQGVAELLRLRRRHVRRTQRLDRRRSRPRAAPRHVVLGQVAGPASIASRASATLACFLISGSMPAARSSAARAGSAGLARLASAVSRRTRSSSRSASSLTAAAPRSKGFRHRASAGRGVGQGSGQAVQGGLRLVLLCRAISRAVDASLRNGLGRASPRPARPALRSDSSTSRLLRSAPRPVRSWRRARRSAS